MKVLVILGSTQRPGSSTTLAEAFSKGQKKRDMRSQSMMRLKILLLR